MTLQMPPATVRTYDAFLQDIELQLGFGPIKTGGQLPGERILAEASGISRALVRVAIRILDGMGILRSPAVAGPKSGGVWSFPSPYLSQNDA